MPVLKQVWSDYQINPNSLFQSFAPLSNYRRLFETRPQTIGFLKPGTTYMPHHQPPGAPSTSADRTVRVASQSDLSGGSIGQDTPELVARFDAEFDEDLFQVVLDGACAQEQPGADLGIRQAVAGQPRDLGLLRGQLFIAIGDAGFRCRLGTLESMFRKSNTRRAWGALSYRFELA
jgi:hypothetical protein